MTYQRDEHRVHLIVDHLIWCPKRRKPVLVGPVAARCRELLDGMCGEQGWEILALAIEPDHIHRCVRVWPSDSAADVVKACKGLTALHLRKEFQDLLKLPSMWTRAYFAATAGHVSQETIQRYIAAQTGRERTWKRCARRIRRSSSRRPPRSGSWSASCGAVARSITPPWSSASPSGNNVASPARATSRKPS